MCIWDFGVCGLGFRRVKGVGITLSQVLGSKSLDQNGLLATRHFGLQLDAVWVLGP